MVYLYDLIEWPHLAKGGGLWGFEGAKATIHNRWVNVGREGGAGDPEDNIQGVQLVRMRCRLEDEGLEYVIPNIFQTEVSEVGQVC